MARAGFSSVRPLVLPCDRVEALALVERVERLLRVEALQGLLWSGLSGAALVSLHTLLGPGGAAVLLFSVAAGAARVASRLVLLRRAARLRGLVEAGAHEELCGASVGELLGG